MAAVLLPWLRGSLSNLYLLVGILVVAFSAISFVVFRMRKTPSFDHVPQNVLDRIRSEYR